MKKLHLLVIKSFIGPLILTFFFVIFVLLMQFLWKYIDDLIGKGLEWNVLSEFLLYTSASLVPLAMPLAVLLASLMTFGNLAENLELLAFKSSGISLVRIMAPVMIISAVISVGAFFFANNVMPVTNLKMRSLLYDIQQQRPELTIKPGIFDNSLEGYSIRIGERDSRTSLLKDIMIFDHTQKQGNTRVTVADSGYMKMSSDEKHLLLSLYNGHSYIEMQKEKKENRHVKSYPLRRDKFDHQDMIIEMTGFGLNRTDENLFRNSYSMLNLTQLKHFDDSLSEELTGILDKFDRTIETSLVDKPRSWMVKRNQVKKEENDSVTPRELIVEELEIDSAFSELNQLERRRAITYAINGARTNKSVITSNVGTAEWKWARLRRYQIEYHRKFTLSLLCLIFFFIGAPLGAIIRKGGLGMPVIVSVLLFLVYYIISMTAEKFVRESIFPPWVGMWISTIIMVPISIWLTIKAANDSVILNIDTYFVWWKKWMGGIRKFFRLK
ncbi:MAG: LptF/LptG family permease [Bacteroidales bacterium]